MILCVQINYRQTTMASANDGDEDDDEEEELERTQKSFLDRKKAVFEKTREADEELLKIRQEEMVVQERLQKIKAGKREMEQMRQTLERLKIENARLKEVQSGHASDSDSMIESLQAEMSCMRRQNMQQSVSLRQVKDAMQRITRYSKTQQKEKEKALRRVASLEDEIAALRLISQETQRRQLNEIQSSSTAPEQQLRRHHHHQQQQQQQQRTGKV